MNIMHVIDSLAVGGAERILIEIANRTLEYGHRVSVCITRSDRQLAKSLAREIPIYVLNRRYRWDMVGMLKFLHLLKNDRPEILHIHGRSSLSFLAFLKLFNFIDIPIVFTDQYGAIEIDKAIPHWFKWLGRNCCHIYVGVCDQHRSWAQNAGLPPDKIEIIENALDTRRILRHPPVDLRREVAISEDALLGITVAGWRMEKGLDILIEAVRCTSSKKQFKIVVVGGVRDETYFQSCQKLIIEYGLQDRFIFLGERSDVPGLLQGADFAIMTSRSESGPLTLIEYMAVGLPFVSTRVGAIAQQAEAYGARDFIPPDNPEAMAEVLTLLLSLSPADLLERGKRSREICLQYFDIQQKMPAWFRVYRKALNEANFN